MKSGEPARQGGGDRPQNRAERFELGGTKRKNRKILNATATLASRAKSKGKKIEGKGRTLESDERRRAQGPKKRLKTHNLMAGGKKPRVRMARVRGPSA